MNYKQVFGVIGRLLQALSVFLLLPLFVSLYYRESAYISFLLTAALSLLLGMLLLRVSNTKNHVIYAKEGFIIVAVAWISTSLIGALPFYLSGEIPSYLDALFETVSGLTTTGASILTNVELLSKGMLFWRSFTIWIGGMGVLVFLIAFVSNISDRTIHILRAEMPGPTVGKLTPRIKDTTKSLYFIYIVLTVLMIVLLYAGGMSFFESVLHAFSTAGTGGFGTRVDSIAGFSPYIQWVFTVFMLLFGVNFNLYFMICIRKFRRALKSSELWTYIAIVCVSAVLVYFNLGNMYATSSETVRHSFFQVASIISTSGFSTTDFNLWPTLSKSILFVLMIIGACAGSTAGGLKISRVIMLFKMARAELKRMLHPRAVTSVKFENVQVDDHTQRSVLTYFTVYNICFFFMIILTAIDGFDFETTISAVAACFNNIGPAFSAAGPSASYAVFSPFVKIVLMVAMLLGRLEIFPLLVVLSPSAWKMRKGIK